MAEKNKIIAFEQLFDDDNKRKEPNYKVPHYLNVILVYLGIFLIMHLLIAKLFYSFEVFVDNYNETEMLVSNVKNDNYSLAYLTKDKFNEFANGDLTIIYEYNDYYIVTNKNNELASDFILDDDALFQVFNNSITTWDLVNKINIYKEKSALTPSFVNLDEYIEVTEYYSLSYLAAALANLIVLLFLLPPLLLLTKKDFTSDFYAIKERKKEWLVILLVGYLYLIIGNLVSYLLSDILSKLFNQPVEVAINQQIIVQALKSNGVIPMVIAAVFIGPIVEEIVFRKAIFGVFKNERIALIVSALFFGIFHITAEANFISSIINGIAYFVMGGVLALIYMKNDKNIYVPIAVHMLANLISVLASIFIY